MSLVVNTTPYKKPVPRRSLKMNSLSQRWEQLRQLAKAELSLSYPSLHLVPVSVHQQNLK